jgi:hypothetical protein
MPKNDLELLVEEEQLILELDGELVVQLLRISLCFHEVNQSIRVLLYVFVDQ